MSTSRSDIHDRSALELRQGIASGECTASELTEHFLERIERFDGEIGAFVTVTAKAARERAARLDDDRSGGAGDLASHPLWGLPFADKDLTERAGVQTARGSKLGIGHIAREDSRIVRDMDAAGGISLGKTNTPEFGFASYTENLIGPPTRNPWDLTLSPGGSSGGAAAAVAARLLPFAPGSDGGGSIRIPAAACGLVGVKPTRGLVPGGSGVGDLAGLPVAGTLTRSVADAALLLDGMIGTGGPEHTLRTPAQVGGMLASLQNGDAANGPRLRIGISTWSPWQDAVDIDLDDSATTALEETAAMLARMGHTVEAAPVPDAWQAYAESFMTAWMGMGAAIPLDGPVLEQLGPLARWLIQSGRDVSSRQLVSALSWLSGFESRVTAAYADFDAIITPVLSGPAPAIGSFDDLDPRADFEAQCQMTPFTAYVNVAGLPAIAMPVSSDPAPIGVQAIGRAGEEVTLLRLAAELERDIRWDQRAPAGFA